MISPVAAVARRDAGSRVPARDLPEAASGQHPDSEGSTPEEQQALPPNTVVQSRSARQSSPWMQP
jgi:hypothetical protein